MSGSPSAQAIGGPKKARIEIIPLIDVIFFLLATFVLFTLSLNKIQSLPVDLPQASANTAPKSDEDNTVILQVSDANTAFWNRELITSAEILPRLIDFRSSRPEARVLITGDDKASYGSAIAALDEVRKAGISQVSIETTYRPSGR